MVSIDYGHDHDDGEVCPGCRFRAALAEYLAVAAAGEEQHWHDTTAEIVELMTTAVAALAGLRSRQFDDDADDDDADEAEIAAATISRLGGAIHELWHDVMDDDK